MIFLSLMYSAALLLLLRLKGWSTSSSLYVVSILSVTTYWGVVSLSGFILFMLSCVVMVRFNVHVSSRDLFMLVFLSLVIFPVMFLSLYGGADIALNLMKYMQILFLSASLVLASDLPQITRSQIVWLSRWYILLNVFIGLIALVGLNAYSLGVVRFSGLSFDANFFSLSCLVLYFSLDLYGEKGVEKKLLILLAVSSLSAGGVILLVFYGVAKRFSFSAVRNAAVFFCVSVISMILYVVIMQLLSDFASNAADGLLKFKLMSLMHRLEAQHLALDLLWQGGSFYWGLGSGRNLELTGIALHNGLLQLIFSHGVLFFILVLFLISYSVKKFQPQQEGLHKKYYAAIYTLLLSCYLVDPIFTLYFHLYILLTRLNYGCAKKNIIGCGYLGSIKRS